MCFKLPKLTKVLSPFSLLLYSIQGYLVSRICFCVIIVQAVAAFSIFAIFVQPNGEKFMWICKYHMAFYIFLLFTFKIFKKFGGNMKNHF